MGARTPTVVACGRDGSGALDGVRDSRLHDARCTRVVSHHVADARGGDGVGAVEGHSVAVATIVTAKLSSVASADELFMPILLLAIAALLSGLVGTILTAMSIADPLRQLRWAHGEVQRGNYNTHMKIYDASMLGLLQAGFNDMVRELSERQRLRDLFGPLRRRGRGAPGPGKQSRAGRSGAQRRRSVCRPRGLHPTRRHPTVRRKSSACSTSSSGSSSRPSTATAASSTSSKATPRWRSSAVRATAVRRPRHEPRHHLQLRLRSETIRGRGIPSRTTPSDPSAQEAHAGRFRVN